MSEGTRPKGQSLPPPYRPASPIRPPMWQWAPDPFDKRFRQGGAEQNWTPLGVLVQQFALIREVLKRECPDTLKELESLL